MCSFRDPAQRERVGNAVAQTTAGTQPQLPNSRPGQSFGQWMTENGGYLVDAKKYQGGTGATTPAGTANQRDASRGTTTGSATPAVALAPRRALLAGGPDGATLKKTLLGQ